ncbi:MAG: 3-phosphoshikimate 1-carboxyvinyltransferase [Oscillospiraceae bacterium]
MDIRISPSRLSGTVKAVASKSDAHRLLICAALSDKATRVVIAERSADIDATAACLTAMGADISYRDGAFYVCPITAVGANPLIDCNESGSTLRFLLPVAAALCDKSSFTGSGKLPQRPIGELVSAMSEHGVSFSSGSLPLEISGRMTGGQFSIPGNVSSQYISGLLMALPLAGGGEIRLTTKLESAAYVDITISAMERFGINVARTESGFAVPAGKLYNSPGEISAEGDWSNSAFFLTAGALGASLSVSGLCPDSVQGDRAVIDVLCRMGAKTLDSPLGISVGKGRLSGCTVDVSEIPDLLPVLSVAAAFCDGETRFINGARLRIKESDRLSSTAALISSLGGSVKEQPDGLIIKGKALTGGRVDGFNDHRIVMSAAIAGAFCKEDVIINGAEAIRKSYPTFFDDYRALGGTADVI